MNEEGLWIVRMGALAGSQIASETGGVVVLHNGRILGGDTWSVYRGTYLRQGAVLQVKVSVNHHFTEGGQSIFGGPLVANTLAGTLEFDEGGNELHGHLKVEDRPEAQLVVLLKRADDLTN